MQAGRRKQGDSPEIQELIALFKALRPHQWSKNLLLAVPPITAQVWMQAETMSTFLLAFAAFSLAASGGYVINDLVDIDADRNHPAKRHRPFAAGQLQPAAGFVVGPVLMLAGIALGFFGVNWDFGALLIIYLSLSLAYSFVFKQRLLLDVIVLAGLYALRLLAGGAAVTVEVSSWLLAFSMFFFLSLAFAKRLVELNTSAADNSGRAYSAIDNDAIRTVGPACGLLSILVLALYINSGPVSEVYAEPRFLWFLCLLMLYWILRLWFLAMRGALHHDPVVFALRDKVSYAVAVSALFVLYLAS
jgi:4-hydroxybenzoate polyprenyltransferase